MNQWHIIDLLLRGIAVGAQLGLGLSLARSARDPSFRIATLLFVIGNICFTLNGARLIQLALGPFQPLVWMAQIGSAGYFWLFIISLFEDRRLTAMIVAPGAALTVIGLIGHYAPQAIAPSVWTLHNFIGLLLAVHALFVILRSGMNDLVEARRRLRVPFLVLIAIFSMILSLAQLGQNLGVDARWYEFANASIQALFGIAGVAVLLEARSALFGAAREEASAALRSPLFFDNEIWLERLSKAMEIDGLWRREGLTVGDLAQAVGLPEHRLRRLINDQLGHRNFPAFINQHRIAEARALLADPQNAPRSIASIAYDLGFGSLGPFNRAFRDATGVTPTEYRRSAISNSLPISQNLR